MIKTVPFLLFVSMVLVCSARAQNRSVYTSLSTKVCKELKSNPHEGTQYEGECPGVGGYKLRFLEGDLRQSIDIIAPNKKKFQLAFWNISGAFSHLGPRAEWRLNKGVPVALIVRFNSQEDPEDPKKVKSSLVVAKISRTEACVTDVIESPAEQNNVARHFADKAADTPCKFPKE